MRVQESFRAAAGGQKRIIALASGIRAANVRGPIVDPTDGTIIGLDVLIPDFPDGSGPHVQ